jgi:hypothetical protein
MEPRRRFVEDVEGASGLGSGKLARELDALRFAAAERRRRLPELHVAEPHVDERSEDPGQGRVGGEELRASFDVGVENVRDAAALVRDAERFRAVPFALADFACDVDVAQEMHFDANDAVAFASLAAAPLQVEAETSGVPAAHTRVGELGEDRSNFVECFRVSARVGSWRPADGVLIDRDHLVDAIEPFDPAMLADAVRRLMQLP